MKLTRLVNYLDQELNLAAFHDDHSNNGLQVEGGAEVKKALFAVDGCLAVFEHAAACNADFIFVHHGISWGAEPRRLTGITAGRLRPLFAHNISLYAAHLPLDANPCFGNNAELAKLVGLTEAEPCCLYDGIQIGFSGTPERLETADELGRRLETALGCRMRFCGQPERRVRRVAIVSGGGGLDALEDAAATGCDTLVTGELTHVMYHPALELGVNVIALGHYATETVGLKALMARVEKEFGIETVFAEFPTAL